MEDLENNCWACLCDAQAGWAYGIHCGMNTRREISLIFEMFFEKPVFGVNTDID